jgi:hypothetical protein
MGEIRGRCKKPLQIDEFRCDLTCSQILGFAADYRGLGREIEYG